MNTWKSGNEFAPYHPDASHVPAEYRDGWNACYAAHLAEQSEAREALREAMKYIIGDVPAFRSRNTHRVEVLDRARRALGDGK